MSKPVYISRSAVKPAKRFWRKDFASVGEGVGPSCNFGMLQCLKLSITKASCHHDCRAYEGLCEAEETESEVWANSKAMEPLHVRMS